MGECCSRGSSRCQRDGEPPPVALEKGTGPEFRWREETQRGTETAPGLSEGARGGPGRTGTQWWGAGGAPGDTRPRGTWAATSHLQSELGHVPHQPVPPRFLLGLRENHGGLRVGARAAPPPPLSGGEQVRGPRRWATFTAAVWGPAPRHALSLPGDPVHTPLAFRHHPVPASAPHTCCSGREPPGPAPLWAPTGISPPSWPVHP